jgi:hypothetical protein
LPAGARDHLLGEDDRPGRAPFGELWSATVAHTPNEGEDAMAEPTREDAQLMIQIAQWGTAMGVDDAFRHLFADDFDPEVADAIKDAAVHKALVFGESIGTLTKRNLLSVELVEDWLWIEGLWSRVGPAARKAREKAGEPRLYENLEALATRSA